MKEKTTEDKDIKNYKLPLRKRTITIPVEEGGRYEFDFCRPSFRQRNEFMQKWGLMVGGTPAFKDDAVAFVGFSKDTIRLSITGGRKMDTDGKIVETYAFGDAKGDDLDNLDSTIIDILQIEAQEGVNISSRDEYFRSKGGTQRQTAPGDAVIHTVP